MPILEQQHSPILPKEENLYLLAACAKAEKKIHTVVNSLKVEVVMQMFPTGLYDTVFGCKGERGSVFGQ